MLNDKDLERYARQAIMPAIGEDGQEKLMAARGLVVGAGGLGAPVILYLAAAGIGTITIIDDDYISLSDLNRQIIYRDGDVGSSKSHHAANAASTLNPNIHISQLSIRLNGDNVEKLVTSHDVVIDCSDNFETRYLIGDAAHHCGRPLVFGGAVRMEGQVSVFQSSVKGHFGSPLSMCFSVNARCQTSARLLRGGHSWPSCWFDWHTTSTRNYKTNSWPARTLTGRLLLIEGWC